MPYTIQNTPFRVPTTDGKTIREYFGYASKNVGDLSVAHMQAPPGWLEPHQTPDFDEITFMIQGKKHIEVDGESITIEAGEAIFVEKGSRVQYSNPFDEKAIYLAICIPAFTLEGVHREEE